MVEYLLVYTDGAARGNPGPSASGFVVYSDEQKVGEEFTLNGVQTNNFAEYRSIIKALVWCSENFPESELVVHSDSELVVKQLNNEYKMRARALMPMKKTVLELVAEFKSVRFVNVPREDSNVAYVDGRLNRLLDSAERGGEDGEA